MSLEFSKLDGLVFCERRRVAQRFVDILGLQIGIAPEDGPRDSPAAKRPSSRATGKRKPRMQGLPVHMAGSTVMRAKVIKKIL